MARIALDARPLEKTYRTGVENVGAQFARLILQVPNRHAWHFYFTDPPKQKLPPPIRWRFYRGPAWLRLVVPLWLLADRIDLVHFYISYVPPLLQFLRTRTIVTVCDVMWLDDLSLIDPPSRKFIVKGVLPSLKFRTDHFIAISEATRNDLVTKLGIEPERISVVLPCAEERWRPCPNASEAVKQLYGLESPFPAFRWGGEAQQKHRSAVGCFRPIANSSPKRSVSYRRVCFAFLGRNEANFEGRTGSQVVSVCPRRTFAYPLQRLHRFGFPFA